MGSMSMCSYDSDSSAVSSAMTAPADKNRGLATTYEDDEPSSVDCDAEPNDTDSLSRSAQEVEVADRLWKEKAVVMANINAVENLQDYELQEEVRQLREEVDILRKKNIALEADRDRLRNSMGHTKESKKQLAQQIESLEAQISTMFVERSDGEQMLAEAFSEVIKGLEAKLVDANQENAKLKKRLKEHNHIPISSVDRKKMSGLGKKALKGFSISSN